MEILQVSRECPGYVSRVYAVSSPLYPKWCGDTRMGSGDHLQLGWFKLHLDWFFKEILNLKREIFISQRIIYQIILLLFHFNFEIINYSFRNKNFPLQIQNLLE